MNALTVCVNYDDYLAITLPLNVDHFDAVLVVTAPHDLQTQRLLVGWENVECYETDAFYRNGTRFNKGLAIEEGFETLGRQGWIMVLDADVVLPDYLETPPAGWRDDSIYSPQRRLCEDVGRFRPGLDWTTLPYGNEKQIFPFEFAGYCQLFHASAECLKERPWYGVEFPTAQACDSAFYQKWPKEKRIRPPFEVLHLGPTRINWSGRTTPRVR